MTIESEIMVNATVVYTEDIREWFETIRTH